MGLIDEIDHSISVEDVTQDVHKKYILTKKDPQLSSLSLTLDVEPKSTKKWGKGV